MDLLATALPLVGVALGTIGTLTGQYLATRGDAQRQANERAMGLRAERKAAIAAFLDGAQRMEQVVDARRRGVADGHPDVDDLLHSLWLNKKLLELVCGYDLARVAHRYTSTLTRLVHAPEPTADLDLAQRTARGEFMETARDELGVTGPQLYRTPAPPAHQ
jgi:hypothetical protein